MEVSQMQSKVNNWLLVIMAVFSTSAHILLAASAHANQTVITDRPDKGKSGGGGGATCG